MTVVFVFGSNLQGRHGLGAAKTAKTVYGAKYGTAEGRTGNAYAIPTKAVPTREQRQLPLEDIQKSVDKFIEYALTHPDTTFILSRVGCGLAGYQDSEIGPMFGAAPENVTFPPEWNKYCKQSPTT